MNVDDIMIKDVISLTPEDTVSKALNLMHSHRVNQIPIVNDTSDYLGMVFAKEFLSVNAFPDSKLKGLVSKTPTLSREFTVERAIEMILNTGNRAFPVIENNSKLVGIVSEMDIVVNSRFGHSASGFSYEWCYCTRGRRYSWERSFKNEEVQHITFTCYQQGWCFDRNDKCTGYCTRHIQTPGEGE